jgi:membrane associated rhomboid family serine protease
MTNAIAIACGVAFAIVQLLKLSDTASVAGGFIPARVSFPALLDNAGLPFPAVPAFLTPLSATFLHEGWLHIGFNMVMLLFCGRAVEQVLGQRLLVVLYVIGAYAAAAGQWALLPQSTVPMIGASGAISALMGAYALLYSNQKVTSIGPVSANVVRMLWLGATWVGLQCMIAVAGGMGGSLNEIDLSRVAIGAHIGGFVAGMLLTRPLLRLRFGQRPRAVT